MIQANELRCGNALYWSTNNDLVFVDSEHIRMCSVSNKSFNELYKLIPITEEWLLKLNFSEGFDWEEGNFTNSLDNSILLYFDEYKNIWVVGKYLYSGFAGSFTKLAEIKYINQLQNLYFALTGEELTLSVT
jgi:hypothetical protein